MSDAVTEIQQDAEDRAEAEAAIAEQIAQLSKPARRPPSSSLLAARSIEEIDFGSPRGWRAR